MLWLLLPVIFMRLLWRATKQPEYLQNVAERFGYYSLHAVKPVIWLHAVSVGEARAAAPLVKRLQESYPGHQLLVTTTTPTGRATCEALFGKAALLVYLPYDYPFAIERFLGHFKPQLGVLLETEIWFNLIHACHAVEIPLLLVNARLSDKSAQGYARFPRLSRDALQELCSIAAQTADDAKRLELLGAPQVSVMGNMKFDIDPPASQLALGQQLREKFGRSRKIFLAASTRTGEEALVLDALKDLSIPGLLAVIVPRHPQRFDEVAALLARRGIPFARRSAAGDVTPETAVVLGDSMGEMFAYYAASDLAFIGGSLMPFGGQNLIEAAACGKPVLIGPYTYNFEQASQLALDCHAAVRVKNSGELGCAIEDLFAHPNRMHKMGLDGLDFVSANRGATGRALFCISQFMPDASSGKITRS